MTIEVVHRGTPPSEIVYAGRCTVCHSTFRCNQVDGKLHRGSQREPGDHVDIACTVCKHPVVHCYEVKPSHSYGTSQFTDVPNFQDR